VTILIGANLLLKSRSSPCKDCTVEKDPNLSEKRLNGRFDFHAFSLGLSRGLIVCPPMLFLLVTYSAAFSTPLNSFALAALFGIGTTISPILLLGGITGWLLNKAPLFRKWISIFGGVLLIVLGLSVLAEAILVN
jgi:cytochrome c biogenesis protein CcdA